MEMGNVPPSGIGRKKKKFPSAEVETQEHQKGVVCS